MKNHHEVGHFKSRLMIGLLSLFVTIVLAGQSFAATTCNTCHGMPPLDSADGSRVPSTGAFKGSHQAHVTAGAVAADCVVCHSAAAETYQMKHSADSANKINMTAGIYSKGTFFNQTSIPILGTCSNVSCHADVYSASTTSPSPEWGTTGNGCATCHSVTIDSTGPATGGHTLSGHATTCTVCHEAGTSQTTKPSVGHADGNIDILAGYSSNVAKHAAGSGYKSCATASCHANVYGSGSVRTPTWGATGNGCSACHSIAIGDNGPNTGSHTAHAGKTCDNCHAVGTTATTAPSQVNGHIDGNVDVYYFNYSANVVKRAPNSGYGSCSTAYCHSNGKGTFASPVWGGSSTGCTFCHPALSAGHNVHINTLLSEISFYGYTSTKSVGATYKFGCANCHPTSVSSHMNNSVEIDLAAATAGGHLKENNGASAGINGSKQCSNVYCHSNGYSPNKVYATTPVWGTTFTTIDPDADKCAACHGNSPGSDSSVGSSAHNAHVVGIHYDDIFNGVSKKLPIGGGDTVNAAHGRNNRSTTINCNVCHAATVASSANDKNFYCKGCHDGASPPGFIKGSALIANKSNHVNGKVDVAFVDQKIATKAQVAQAAFVAYTAAGSGGWSRNNGIYKTYTSGYDVTKASLSASPAYTTAAGCAVACHSSITVKWTDTISCQNCHTRLK